MDTWQVKVTGGDQHGGHALVELWAHRRLKRTVQGIGQVLDFAERCADVGHVPWAELRIWVFDIDLAPADVAVQELWGKA